MAVFGCAPAPVIAPVIASVLAPADAVQAWVQADAHGAWVVRALTAGATCPDLQTEHGTLPMRTRAAPAVVAARAGGLQADVKASVFAQRSCEREWPAGVRTLRVGAVVLPAPPAEPRRILLIGDTGCRMKQSDNAFQDCKDPALWPFAAVARAAAAQHPDLIVHVGDIHYRESPCPADRPGCAGSPWGYGEDAWQADFFAPAAPLLGLAPWVFVRGNHESCARAGVGWRRYVDAQPWRPESACEDSANDAEGEFSEPYVVALSDDTQLVVFDSAFVASRAYQGNEPAFRRYASQLVRVAELARGKRHNIFINHHPVLGFGSSATGAPRPGHAGLASVMRQVHPQRLFAGGVDLVLSGHVHLFEALGFSSDHPASVVLGNSGSAMEGFVDAAVARRAQPAPGAVVAEFATQPGFGFATLDRADDGWQLTEWSSAGLALQRCRIRGTALGCGVPP